MMISSATLSMFTRYSSMHFFLFPNLKINIKGKLWKLRGDSKKYDSTASHNIQKRSFRDVLTNKTLTGICVECPNYYFEES